MRIECSQAKETTIHLESKAQQAGLESYIASVQERFNIRFPGIAYDAPRFDFRLPSGQTCWRRPNIEPPCRLDIEPGKRAGF